MIEVRDLHKSYKTRAGIKHVLRDVNFDLAMGEKLGVLGRNGAGKSTLIRLVSGAERPNSGTVTTSMSVSWPLAFGGAFQPLLTGVDNIRFISRIYGQDFDSNLSFIEDFAELGPYLREPVRTYSSGMRARLAFAISMIIEFDCFLIDEVVAVGDARFHERCNYELFDKRSDRAMMIISHDPGYLRDHCNRWAVLDQAQMVHFADFDEAQDFFLDRIGSVTQAPVAPQPFSRRLAAIDSLSRVAHVDERFISLVRQADRARDQHDWAVAEKMYAEALSLHPYERSYWSQYGHVAREQGKRELAEIAYRTAAAYGESVRALMPFIEAVNPGTLTDERLRVIGSNSGETRVQPVGYPDIMLLAGLFCKGDLDETAALDLMRDPARLDEVAARMFEESLQSIKSNNGTDHTVPDGLPAVPGHAPLRHNWLEDICRLSGADFAGLTERVGAEQRLQSSALLNALLESGGFSGWRISQLAHS